MNQENFLQKIQDIIPSNTSLVNELCDVLNISQDSAYRRLRGETQLNISEVSSLCKHYRISFDVFDDMDIDNVTFSFLNLENSFESFTHYLKNMIKDLTLIKNASQSHITYACEDIPIFYNYKYPHLGAFKMFYWMQAILDKSESSSLKLDTDSIPEEMLVLGKQVFETYIETASTEIWTETTYLSVLKQIEYFWESGKFANDEMVYKVLDDLQATLEDIQLQAEVGRKLIYGTSEHGQKASYELYISEIEIGNNCVLVDLGHTKSVYLGHMSFNTISTMNKKYSELTESWLNTIIKKSHPVSKFSEIYRVKFFRNAQRRIDEFRNRIR